MIRVLHVFNCFDQGGIENFLMNVYRKIDRSKIQFDFAFIRNKKGCFDNEVKDMGGNIYFFDSDKISFFNFRRNLTRIIKDYGPFDVIHSHIYFFSGFVLSVAKKCNVPIRISHSHETKKGRKETVIRKLYEKYMRYLILKNATNLLCCSKMAGEYVFGKNAKFDVLYNGIDVHNFAFSNVQRAQIRSDLGINSETKIIIHVGRFADQKNHGFLIDAFNIYHTNNPNSYLLLIGDGAEKNEIDRKIDDYKLGKRVIIKSNIYNPSPYYSAADIFAFPSKYEGMGIVTIEAQTSGLPSLLSSEITREVGVTPLAKFLDIHNPELWAEEMLNANNNNNRSNAYKAIENSSFDILKTVAKLTNIYMGLIDE